jgi:cytochrome c oxidase subunit 1
MGFAASWVFLYPLPFYGAGEWGDWATGLFSFSVLLAGLSIVTWCLGILHTVLGPGLHATSQSVLNRLGVALGWGYLWPRRFATNPRSVPYAVIPLTVIGIDMIIATLPFAGLLVWQILQSAHVVGETDPLLAKNILWWFGHPVVYLLLFPAAALYYMLVPRYAGRPLVAGNVIAVAWIVAVIANVLVWAHHIYLDYPEHTVQAHINTLMQPTTFALVLPSALSLYSLAFTIYRSSFRWTPASTALFLGLVGWLLAGLSGIVNATIAFDAIVHNTLWVVGHFHHMAMLNIGLLIFGATYALLPELTGKALASERAAWVHVWTTFVAGTVAFGIWLVQGLDGAPRRFSVLPERYDTLTRVSLAFVVVLALVQVLFFWNVWATVRGRAGVASFDDRGLPIPAARPSPGWNVAVAEAAAVLLALFLVAVGTTAGYIVGRESAERDATTATPPATSGPAPVDGAALFASAGCGGCHTFAAAGSTGTVGPSLDDLQLDPARVEDVIANGRGAMPAFSGRLSDEEIEAVATYVSGTSATPGPP